MTRLSLEEVVGDARATEFLRRLVELCGEYGMSIDGCGCCGSPWVFDNESENTVAELLDVYSVTKTICFELPSGKRAQFCFDGGRVQ